MSSLAISVENVSKVYRLGEINRSQLFGDVRRWISHKLKSGQSFGDPAAEAEETPAASDIFYALRDVSFQIKEGEAVGILGVNGAGKSTLLKLISRITIPSRGSIRVKGRIGSLLEVGTGFHPDLTGRDNVFLNGAILGMTWREVRAKFDEIVAFSGIEKFIDTPVKRYSSGMYVRLAFSVATFLEPEILIMDEVLAVGDVAFRRKCLDRMEYLSKRGHTMISVSHFTEQITRFCSRAIWLKNGALVADGPVEDICEAYRNSLSERSPTELLWESDEKDVIHFPAPQSSESTKILRITSFTRINQDGRAGPVTLGQSCRFQLGYECLDVESLQSDSIRAVLIFLDEQGRRTMAFRSDYLGLKIQRIARHGHIIFQFAKFPLLPGRYQVRLRVIADGKIHDEIKQGISLTVNEGDFYASGQTPLKEFTPICVEASAKHSSNFGM